MRLHLACVEAVDVAAEIQIVKHFSGLVGGAEEQLDRATRGQIRRVLNTLEAGAFGASRLI